ncbi:MAG: hypothetical protein JKY70_21965 [Mucilaginibacter sp.]|nr:hypothetical protein [Mucilaginibacter sp.]
MLKNWLLIGGIVASLFNSSVKAQKLNGVYAGAQLYNSPFNGMQINYYSVYFRPDGSYTDNMKSRTWRTDVTGKYSVSGGMVHFVYEKDNETYKINKSGNLESTQGIRHTLNKVKPITALPAAAYERKSASGSGGIGTNTPYVGAFSSDFLFFDGKGNFTTDHSSVVGIAGETATGGSIGGKFSNDKSAAGTYQLSAGEITLKFNNGKVEKHSLFYSPPAEQDMLVMDGDFYFRKDKEELAKERPIKSKGKVSGNVASSASGSATGKDAGSSKSTLSAADLVSKLRSNYGGNAIDKINTVKEKSTITGNMQAVAITDITAKKFRLEIRQGQTLLMVKQSAGADSWQWVKGSKTPLAEKDKKEMELSLYQGIMGLHKSLNSYLSSATVTESKGDRLLTFFVNGSKVIYLVDTNNSLKANAYTIAGTPNFSVYRNFLTKDGITFPSVTESSDGKNKLTITTTDIEFNPVLTADTWKAP